jgi:tetratricopeptide (TPR) repeat protein
MAHRPAVLTTVAVIVIVTTCATTGRSQSAPSAPGPSRFLAKELMEAAVSYRDGRFADAEAHATKALEIDPQNPTAPYFIARCVHAQYKPGATTEENLATARRAIAAYQQILARFPHDDEAYKAIAFLYGALKEDELLRNWIFARAADTSVDSEKRAEAYIALASKDWDCSFKITESPTNKSVVVQGKRLIVHYRKPADPDDYRQVRECAERGLQMIDMAVTLTPTDPAAWSYKANILLELEKLSEMDRDLATKAALHREYEQALAEATRLTHTVRNR